MEYYSAIKKNKIMPFAATWMNLDSVILSEVSQTEKKYHLTSLISEVKKEMIQKNLFMKQKDSQTYKTNLQLLGGKDN